MKKILLFSFLFLVIPTMITFYFFQATEEKFLFSSNTMVRILRTKTGEVDRVPLEEYVIGVVAGEMPISFEEEALKAQAVASRSYVMYQIEKNQKKEYDVKDTVLNQVYLDSEELKNKWGEHYEEYYNKLVKVVEDTAYQYIVYQDEIAEALFFSTSSGYTENSEEIFSTKVPYLRSVKSEWDNISPVFQNITSYSKEDFLGLLNLTNSNTITIQIMDKTTGGKINKIKINGEEYTGSQIVSLLKLKSRSFTITVENSTVSVQTRGYGHGVGMSQYGAEGMAQEGYTYDQILKYYYTDVEIKKIKN